MTATRLALIVAAMQHRFELAPSRLGPSAIRHCPVCNSSDVILLAVPHPNRSMSSEGRIAGVALERASCNVCGYGFHAQPLTTEDRAGLYGIEYDLGLQDAAADRDRAQGYADRIEAFVAQHGQVPPRKIVEFGSGTGALLSELTRRWPIEDALGVEPAQQLVRVAQENAPSNVVIRHGFAEAGLDRKYDLCVSINVVEHALDPVAFLSACLEATVDTGAVVIICPDGDAPSSELLFRDHVSSFSVMAFERAALRAGLRVVATTPLVGRQAGFRIFLLGRYRGGAGAEVISKHDLSRMRNAYLKGWSSMQRHALTWLSGRDFSIFGAGEQADLLEAYCPELMRRSRCYYADDYAQAVKNGRPVIAADELLRSEDIALAAVNPRSWSRLKQRFSVISHRFVHPYQFCSLRSQLS